MVTASTLALPARGQTPAGVTAFVGVTVVPMDRERGLPNQTVVVKQGRITALGPSAEVKVPEGAVRIDGRGKYLIPGLADMHTHLMQVAANDPADRVRALLAYVAAGVTTVRNMDYMSAEVGPPVLALRARAAAGELVSPRIYTSGLWGRPTAGMGGSTRGDRRDTAPAEVAAQVAAYQAAGYDHLKTREDIDPTTAQGRALFDSLVAAARRLGLPVVGHVASEPGWFERHPAALKSIEHLSAYTIELGRPPDYAAFYAKLPLRVALTKQHGVWNCPTWGLLDAAAGRLAVDSQVTIPGPEGAAYRRRVLDYLTAGRRLIKALQDAGAGLLLGTDRGSGTVSSDPGKAVNDELRALVRAGLTPYQALATGTRNAAEFFGTLPESGTIAVGKRADLVLLAGDPLEDIRHVAEPAGTMLGGRWLPRAELERRLTALGGGE